MPVRFPAFQLPIRLAILVAISACCPFPFSLGDEGTNGKTVENNAAKLNFFEAKIRPVLIEHCYECHSSATGDPGGNFRLDTASALRSGGSMGEAIQADSPETSLLLRAITYEDSEVQMPPTGKLPQHVIDDVRVWLAQGAFDPRIDDGGEPSAKSKSQLADEHWAFQPIPRGGEPGTSIDDFLAKGLASKGLIPNERAMPRDLVRRLYNDLLGLAPTRDEMLRYEFESNESFEASYEKLVDQLIGSEHFGERMARRWMDVARYADNKGYVFQEDREYHHAWKYRAWLIDSFNEDLPFDQFTNLQIAADQLEPGPENRNLHAMGFLTLGRRFLNNENDIADDRIDLVTRGFLGLSVACARCHDHKFDPISMADYYSLHSTFVSSKEPKDEPGPLRMVDSEKIRPAVIFKRGQAGARGDQVPRTFIKFISSVSRPMEKGSGRIDLAEAISDPKNPLTSRVIVNRVWGWLMGAALVDTPSDFGLRTEEPLQRELLDHLAGEFLEDGQSIKRLVKRIVMSEAYRRSSLSDAERQEIDPENRYWWRGVRKRLDFESLRDNILVATRQLDRQVGGKSVKMVNAPYSKRRTIYAYIDRQNLEGLFRSFDFASPDAHVPYRFSTTVPQQALFMMNSSMIDHYATRFAESLYYSEEGQVEGWVIEQMFESILNRGPTPTEEERFSAYLRSQSAGKTGPEVPHIANTVKVLLCTNEFCFID